VQVDRFLSTTDPVWLLNASFHNPSYTTDDSFKQSLLRRVSRRAVKKSTYADQFGILPGSPANR
jgi:hypothetical protein